MKQMTRVGIVAVLLVAVGALWYATRHEAEGRLPVEAGDEATLAVRDSVNDLPSEESSGLPIPPSEAMPSVESREPVSKAAPSALLSGRIVDPDGNALAGATLSWTAWTDGFTANAIAKTLPSSESIRAHSELTSSDSEGHFSFHQGPKGLGDAEKSVLWITHFAHEARSYLLWSEPSTWPDFSEVLLKSAPSMVARVTASGEPALGAIVVQRASAHRRPSRLSGEVVELRSPLKEEPLVFLRAYETDAGAQALLVPLPHGHYLQAELGEQLSAPWIGWGGPSVTLDIASTFTVQGAVILPAIDESWGTPRVIVHRSRAGVLDEIGVTLVEEDGSFGPLRIPLLPAEEYVARLDGSTLVPQEMAFAAPRADEEVFLKFEGETGSPIFMLGVNEAGEYVLDTEASVYWSVGGRRIEQVVQADELGFLLVPAVPPGELRGIIRAPGYFTVPIATILVPEREPRTHTSTLRKGARIEGVCLQDGKPAPDFEVRYSSVGFDGLGDSLVVRGSKDGRFAIDGARPGSVGLEAFTSDYERSARVYVEADSQLASEVTLELVPARIARGKVVAAGTRESLSAALIQIVSSDQYRVGEPIGPPDAVALDGSFEIAKLGPGIGIIQVSAPGYSSRIVRFRESSGQVEDLGTIELESAQPLRVRILSNRPTDFSPYTLAISEGAYVPRRSFSSEGTVFIEEMSAGNYEFAVIDLYSSKIIRLWKELLPGEDWTVDFDLTGACAVSIEVLAGDEDSVPPMLAALCTLERPGEAPISREVFLDEQGRGVLEGVKPGTLKVWVRASYPGIEGKAALVIGEQDLEAKISVSLSSRPMRVRVVDREGAPLSSVQVVVYSSVNRSILQSDLTDIAGECTLEAPEGADLVALTDSEGGVVIGLPFAYPGGEEDAVEFVFDSSSSLELTFGGDEVPESGLECRLFDPIRDRSLVAPQTPDASRRLTFERIGPGTYQLEIRGKDCWPITREVVVGEDRHSISVDLRRLGGIRLMVQQADGSPAPGVPVELACEGLDGSVSEWIADGQVPEAALITDTTGKLELTGIPRGSYRWSCAGTTGVVAVAAGVVAAETIFLP